MTLPGTKDYDELHLLAEWNQEAIELGKRLHEAFAKDEPHPTTHEINEASE